MLWFPIWLSFAILMFILMVVSNAEAQTYGLCFVAWCGGVVSTLAFQEFKKRRLSA